MLFKSIFYFYLSINFPFSPLNIKHVIPFKDRKLHLNGFQLFVFKRIHSYFLFLFLSLFLKTEFSFTRWFRFVNATYIDVEMQKMGWYDATCSGSKRWSCSITAHTFTLKYYQKKDKKNTERCVQLRKRAEIKSVNFLVAYTKSMAPWFE